MTSTQQAGHTDAQLDEIFTPVLEQIAEGAVRREEDRTLARDEVAQLNKVRFGARRVPV